MKLLIFCITFETIFLIKTLPTLNPYPRPAVDASELQVQEDNNGNIQEENQGDHRRLFSTVLNILNNEHIDITESVHYSFLV